MAVTPRSICLVVQKASPGPYWGKLLKAPGKPPHNVRVDWSKYKDEDEEAEGAGARPREPHARPAAPCSVRAASRDGLCSMRARGAMRARRPAAQRRLGSSRTLVAPTRGHALRERWG